MTGFGLAVADFDHDGWQDLYVANGRVTKAKGAFSTSDPYVEPNHLFRGLPAGTFAEVAPVGGVIDQPARTSRGVASGDLDGDGFADAVGLGQAVFAHPGFAPCVVDTLWAFANGRMPKADEAPVLDALSSRFGSSDYRLVTLLEDIAMSEAFRLVGPIEEVAP